MFYKNRIFIDQLNNSGKVQCVPENTEFPHAFFEAWNSNAHTKLLPMISIFIKTEMDLHIITRISDIKLNKYPCRGSEFEICEWTDRQTRPPLYVFRYAIRAKNAK